MSLCGSAAPEAPIPALKRKQGASAPCYLIFYRILLVERRVRPHPGPPTPLRFGDHGLPLGEGAECVFNFYLFANRYPTPREVNMNSGLLGSFSIFLRR